MYFSSSFFLLRDCTFSGRNMRPREGAVRSTRIMSWLTFQFRPFEGKHRMIEVVDVYFPEGQSRKCYFN